MSSTAASSTAAAVKRGAFILFEGLDRCGKSTQCELLVKYLNQAASSHSSEQSAHNTTQPVAVHYRFPNRSTTIGQMINSYLTNSTVELDDRAIHLLFSANRWEAQRDIVAALNAGQHVVCDRYIYSGVAFSAAKGLPIDWCFSCDIDLPSPDLVIYIDIDHETAMKRGGYGAERYEKQEIQERVRAIFETLIKNSISDVNWQRIDGSASVQQVSQRVQEASLKSIADIAADKRPVARVKPLQSTQSSTVAG